VKNLTPHDRRIGALTALVFTVALLLAISHNLRPLAVWSERPQTPVALTAVPVGTVNKPVPIVRTGSIESSASVPITADFTGRLSEIYVTEGQAVKAGQSLLKLQAASDTIATQTTGVSQQTQDNYDNALKEFTRDQKLYAIGGIPRRQLEIATARLQEAKELLTNAGNAIQSANSTIKDGFATISAPIDGIVTGLSTAPGKTAQAGQQLLSLGNGQDVEVVAQLNQNDLYLVHLGTAAAIEVSQQTIVGQVSRIYPQAEADQNPSFLAHVKLTAYPPGLLKPGMPVTAKFDTGQSAIAPAVPKQSVFQDDQGQSFIYLAVNDKAVLQPIRIGETIGDYTEITSDLPQPSLVITSNINDIKDGAAISVAQ
jgi:RND family efflux transporter MFP subunit